MESISGGLVNPVKDNPGTTLTHLQGLRAIAAIMVVVFHIFLWQGKYFPGARLLPNACSAGEAGVDLFFVISGFIMMHITPAAFQSGRDQGIFLFRRFARIFPPYWAVAIPALLIWRWKPYLFNAYAGNHVDVIASLTLCPSTLPKVIFVAWTLTNELSYYLIASMIFYWEGSWRSIATLVWLAIIAGALFAGTYRTANPWFATLLHPLTIEFIAGMLLAHFLKRGLTPLNPLLAAIMVAMSCSIMAAWGAYHGVYFLDFAHMYTRVLFYGLPSVLIVWSTLQMDLQNEWKWFTRLAPVGNRSYAIYLIHLPVVVIVYHTVSYILPHSSTAGIALVIISVVILVGVAAEFLYRCIERPSHEWARRRARRARPIAINSSSPTTEEQRPS